MSTRLQQIQALAAQVKDVGIDMSEVSKGGQGRRLLPAGNALGRFVLYREFGKQAREFQGVAKAPAMEARLGFILWGKGVPSGPDTPDNMYHSIVDGVVKPGLIESFGMSLGNNEKAKVKIAFDKMNYKGTSKRFIELVGEPFIVPIKVVQPAKKDAKPRNAIDWAGILPPNDPISGQAYPVPEAKDEDYKVFLWDAPTQEDWDAMHIEGTNDQGKSKNFLQARCLEATDFEGSLLQQLLGGNLPDIGMVEREEEEDEQPEAPAAAATTTPSVPAVPGIPADVPFTDAKVATVTSTPAVPSVPSVPSVPGIPSIPGLPS